MQSSPCNLSRISFHKEGYKYLSKHGRGRKKQNRDEEAQRELQEGRRNEDVTYTGKNAKDLPGCTCPEREPRCLQQSEAAAEGSDLGEVEGDEETGSP